MRRSGSMRMCKNKVIKGSEQSEVWLRFIIYSQHLDTDTPKWVRCSVSDSKTQLRSGHWLLENHPNHTITLQFLYAHSKISLRRQIEDFAFTRTVIYLVTVKTFLCTELILNEVSPKPTLQLTAHWKDRCCSERENSFSSVCFCVHILLLTHWKTISVEVSVT